VTCEPSYWWVDIRSSQSLPIPSRGHTFGLIYKSGANLSANYIYGQILKKLHNWISCAWRHVLGRRSRAW